MPAAVTTITPQALRAALDSDGELALFDVRDEAAIRAAHIFHAAYLPLSWPGRRERAEAVVPRKGTLVVLTGDEPAVSADADAWRAWGFTDVRVLDGGLDAWTQAGYSAFRHVAGPSKALAEAGREAVLSERIWAPADLLAAREKAEAAGALPPLLLDVRSGAEYARATIPGALGLPGGELVASVPALLAAQAREAGVDADPARPVVITCAYRTRGQFGAASLQWWGLPNPAYFLEGGTQAWVEAGGELEPGSAPVPPLPTTHALEDHPATGGIPRADPSTVDKWLAEPDRTTYLLDPRLVAGTSYPLLSPAAAARVRHVPGGQYIESIDEYTPVYRSRVVLVDAAPHTRALALARWLRASRLVDVYVFGSEHTAGGILPGQRTEGDNEAGMIPDYTEWSRALPRSAAAELGPFVLV
ncbi:uncharacterized protein LOC62_01G000597 [Vanrija pseudolonga]|uniref:Rhodanese domain-containing protein n=1 Tax=Vanrija pseudolonga TaxID=143232 RepID=A0AAF0Y3M7_9TREE|nr:hypothetical protein LOC62_01G000597 [Vanrija pseudolonga]